MSRNEFWTEEKIERLRSEWASPLRSASEIARVLGCTKNAVIGKASRLELDFRLELEPLPERPPHPLTSVRAGQCLYPIGMPRSPDFHYCRDPVDTPAHSYCDHHHAIAWGKPISAKK